MQGDITSILKGCHGLALDLEKKSQKLFQPTVYESHFTVKQRRQTAASYHLALWLQYTLVAQF
jgi:hypothetical protein